MDQNNTGSSVPSSPPADQPAAPNPLAAQPSVPIGPKPDASAPGATAGIPQPSAASAPNPINPNATIQATPPPPVPAPHKAKPMLWVMILLVFAFFCGLLLAVWYFQTQLQKASPSTETTTAPVATPSKITIGTDGTFPPMESIASGGALMGYDIDLGNRIGEELGAEVEFKNIPWDDLFKALENKQIDMIMSSVTVTEERKQIYDFSQSYLNAGQVVISRKNDTTITSAQDLQGKRIAVQEGTTNETEALKLTTETLVIRFPDFVLATKALVDGNADAILSDLPGAKGIITENPTLKIASDPLTNEYYGIVFRKGDPIVEKINEILSSFRTQGVLTDLKQKWLD
jgi:ABC-type amino acid transport substrate-binding protein